MSLISCIFCNFWVNCRKHIRCWQWWCWQWWCCCKNEEDDILLRNNIQLREAGKLVSNSANRLLSII